MKKGIVLVGSNFTRNNKNRDGNCLRLTNIYSSFLLLGVEARFISIDTNNLEFNNDPNIYRFRSLMNLGPLRSISFDALKMISNMLNDSNNIIIFEGLHPSLLSLFLPKKFKSRIYISLIDFTTYAVFRCLLSKISILNFFKQSLILLERFFCDLLISLTPYKLFFVSENDANLYKKFFKRETFIYTNGVQCQDYSYLLNNDNKAFNVLYLANMTSPMNKEAREWILRNLISNSLNIKNTNIKFFIIGLNAHSSDLMRDSIIRSLIEQDYLKIVSSPDVLDLYFQKANLQICPMQYGTGIKNTVLEGMSFGVPQLVTPLIASPIGIKNNYTGFVSKRDLFFKCIFELSKSENFDKLKSISEESWRLINKNFAWKNVVNDFLIRNNFYK